MSYPCKELNFSVIQFFFFLLFKVTLTLFITLLYSSGDKSENETDCGNAGKHIKNICPKGSVKRGQHFYFEGCSLFVPNAVTVRGHDPEYISAGIQIRIGYSFGFCVDPVFIPAFEPVSVGTLSLRYVAQGSESQTESGYAGRDFYVICMCYCSF